MKILALLAISAIAWAQQPAADTASPVPSTEETVSGWIELGWRWRTSVAGSFDTYRSIINLGSGPKLFGADFTLKDPKHRFYDQLHVLSSSWGDEPSSSVHIDASKSKYYRFTADDRDAAYFNNLPSFADPLLSRGVAVDEQAFDTRRHIAAVSLDLMPESKVIPYLAWDHESNSGTGSAVFVDNNNQYPAPERLRDGMNLYRGGVRIEFPRLHITLEEGGTTYKDDESLFQNSGSTNYGNSNTPVFGQTLDLASLIAAYGIRGTSIYTKALVTANVASWIDFFGQFLFSQPHTDVSYNEYAKGTFYLPSQIAFYNTQQFLLNSAATMPHTTGTAGVEIRPIKRVRVTAAWLTDRLHNSGYSSSSEPTLPLISAAIAAQSLAESLASNYNQVEVNIFWDAFSKLTLRGGYRNVWGDASDQILPLEGLAGPETSSLRREVAIGGFNYRPKPKFSLSADAEAGSSLGVYFRTSLYNYQRVRVRSRYEITKTLHFSAAFHLLNNQNPTPGLNYSFSAQQESASLSWTPGKVFAFEGAYAYSDLHSSISYLEPDDLASQTSVYREDAHSVTSLLTLNLPSIDGIAPKFTAGGSFYTSGGTLPTSYFQPMAKLRIPTGKHLEWFGEWRYFDYGQIPQVLQGFRATVAMAGLRISK